MITAFLDHFFSTAPFLKDVLIFCMIITAGFALGQLQVFKLKLGVTGVLFSGILFSHFVPEINPQLLTFVKSFGLILFVFMLGLDVGPGFLNALRRHGKLFNGLAAAMIGMGLGIVLLGSWLFGLDPIASAGIFSGAMTNTPSLGVIEATLVQFPNLSADLRHLPSLSHAVTYPFGILGSLLALMLIKLILQIKTDAEADQYTANERAASMHWSSASLRVENPKLDEVPVYKVPFLKEKRLVISRLLHGGQIYAVTGNTVLHLGDVVHVVGPEKALEELSLLIGEPHDKDLLLEAQEIITQNMMLTRREMVGRTVKELRLSCLVDVIVSQVTRGGLDLPVSANLILQLGDTITAVGEREALEKLSKTVGNTVQHLDKPQWTPIFLGITLGLFVGSIPVVFPGLPQPVTLGLAGGPLITAMALSRMGQWGKLIWYVPQTANLHVREFGAALFLASEGLMSGGTFLEVLIHGNGLAWFWFGTLVTLVPMITVGFIARKLYKLNFLTLAGLFSGTMTNSVALNYGNSLSDTNASSVAYSTVYPFAMIIKIIAAQLLLILLSL